MVSLTKTRSSAYSALLITPLLAFSVISSTSTACEIYVKLYNFFDNLTEKYNQFYRVLAGPAGVARQGSASVMTGFRISVQPVALASGMGLLCEQ